MGSKLFKDIKKIYKNVRIQAMKDKIFRDQNHKYNYN